MPNAGLIAIVQSVRTAVPNTPTAVSRTAQELIRYYAMKGARWQIEYARNTAAPHAFNRSESQARVVGEALATLQQHVTLCLAPLLHPKHKNTGGWEQYWSHVYSRISDRNHMIVAPMEEAARHVDVIGRILSGESGYSSSFLPTPVHDGKIVIFAPFTVERYLQRNKNEPYDVDTLLQG